jgi:hypothetical protein
MNHNPDESTAEAPKDRSKEARTPALKGAYYVAQGVLPRGGFRNIGVILCLDGDRLLTRWRRDLENLPSGQPDWLKQLTSEILEKTKQLGPQKCLQWLRAKSSGNFRISLRRPILIADSPEQVLDKLYAQRVHPQMLPFRTHLPQYSLEAAAGKFGRKMDVVAEGWVEVQTDLPLTDDMFVAHVEGHSMEPLIPAASLCAFRHHIASSWDGKVLLIQQHGYSEGNRFTIKLCRLRKHLGPAEEDGKSQIQERISLESLNPDYESWDLPKDEKIGAIGEFLFVVGPRFRRRGILRNARTVVLGLAGCRKSPADESPRYTGRPM